MEREEGREININVREKHQSVASPMLLEQRLDALGPEIGHAWTQDQTQNPARKPKSKWMTFTLIICIIIPVAFIIIVIMVLPSRNSKTIINPQNIKCPVKWIEVRYKCFYFSDDTRNWTASKTFCKSQRSELAQIDTHQDLEFLKKHTGTFMHWIGLSRKQGEPWKWTNGKTFSSWFEITGNGYYAFLNADGVNSSRGFEDMKWICSKPQF
ncbi:C-type lectin domain family 2 member A-like [Artibeus jamaicensis]|uniref:C-type lectin domain family 2 member A-like n=1 Tax=Artibeus jamaicensis TaxID=9417 RepID=UPI00235A64CC|nr:C-type lectin domain family 2 member A-like [Artibeus jamaicensis]XP_053517968.1 C-type lectin domain family 2 member A-like [Artibeus jamaicensis]XP_053517969.1 C-type lectin domain family 2 member A-like [Artibeus jamaicensis]XP_053517970.1 C-type lectin domain family 2 member A-like [Artibeus jamaicensis]